MHILAKCYDRTCCEAPVADKFDNMRKYVFPTLCDDDKDHYKSFGDAWTSATGSINEISLPKIESQKAKHPFSLVQARVRDTIACTSTDCKKPRIIYSEKNAQKNPQLSRYIGEIRSSVFYTCGSALPANNPGGCYVNVNLNL